MKLFSFLTLFSLVFGLVPLPSLALTPMHGDVINIDQTIRDDLYGAGGDVTVQKNVEGDALLVGGDITIVGPVAQDLFAIGGEVLVSSPIGDDVRAVGGSIVVEENIAGDLLVVGGTVSVKEDVVIDGDVMIIAGEVKLSGQIQGDLRIHAGEAVLGMSVGGDASIKAQNIVVSDLATIDGSLYYATHDQSLELEDRVNGEVDFHKLKNETSYTPFLARNLLAGLFFLKMIFLIVFASLLYFGLPALSSLWSGEVVRNPGKSSLTGLLWYLLVPFATIFLVGTVIGFPIAFALLVAYIFSFLFMELANVIVFSKIIIENIGTKKQKHRSLHLGIIILLAFVSSLIAGLDIIAGVFSVGALLRTVWILIKKA